ncbi:MAG: DUF4957 domain-containing protein [Bacteroidales bacterium]|nr:DUF4957 domain-containing protein [Bacteroidales bacterium]
MKYKSILKYIAAAVLALGAVSCALKEQFDEITEMNLSRCLEPMNLDARVNAALGDVVTFTWDVAKDAEEYLLNIYTDAGLSSLYSSTSLEPSQVPYTVKLEADATYYFSVQARKEGKQDSKVASYTKAIKTYAVKDNLFLKLVERTATSLTVGWSTEVPDFQEVDRVVYRLAGSSEESTHELSAQEIENGKALLEGLTPSTEYEIILFFKSASRGMVNAWTAASAEGLTEVSSLDGLLNAVKTPDAKIYLMLSGSPYDIEALDIANGFSLTGELDVDGNMPVLTGELHIADTWSGKNLRFENIAFDGAPTAAAPSGFGFAIQNKNGGTLKGKEIGDLIYKNCVITNYTKGLIYEWGNDMVLGEVTYDSCEITNINADGTVGGDVFDIRQATTIGALNFVNNTIAQGMRTFVRMDAGTLGKLVFENNTLFNLCFVDNTNNAGIFGLQIVPGEFSFKKNLFLGMTGKATLESANTKYKTASDMSVAASENYFWGLPVGDDGAVSFFTDNFTAAQAGAVILEDAPCYNAAGGYFNILASSDIAGKGIGASKWWTPFVEEPEDLTMTLVPVPHTWNLGNAKFFSGSIKKQMVRDYLLVSATEDMPIVAADGMLAFGGPVVVNRAGVPQHNYLAFQTDKPGSLVIKADNAADYTSHLVVGVGPLDGTSIALKGGVSDLQEQDNATKILISSITEPSIVYIYPSGPVSLASLSWTDDETPVNTALPAPEAVADPASITAGEAKDITISWIPVPNAGSYSVVFNGKASKVDECEFVIGGTTTSMLDAGAYKVEVYANPGASDIYNTESAAGVAAFAVLPAGGGDSSELVVNNVDGLLAAITAGKDAVTLAPGEYKLGGDLTVTAPLALKGQDGAVVYGGFKLSGEVGRFSTENLTVIGSDPENKSDIFLNLDNTGVSAEEIVIRNTVIDGFAKSVIYASNTADVFQFGDIVFDGILVKNHGTGQGVLDLRNGKYNSFTLKNSTVSGGRDFLRIDAPCVISAVYCTNNTLYNLNDSANAGGVFCVRATPSVYEVSYNIVAGIANSISGRTAAMKPKMKKNVWFNIGEKFYTGCIDADLAVDGGGVLLSADPFKDAAAGDFTLTNAVVMSLGAGDPRWNPATASISEGNSFTVSSAEEFTAAVEAGKTDITFADGEYDLSASALTLTAGMHLKGNGGAVVKVGQINLAEGELGTIVIEGLTFEGDGANNFLNIGNASVLRNLTVRNVNVSKIGKSLFYGNADGSSFDALVFDNVFASELGGGQGTIDIRKGAYGVVTVSNSTFAGGRDFIRADAGKVTGAVNIVNNTFDGVTLNNGNGVLYVRSTPETYVFKNNLFLNENGSNNLLSKASGVTVPDQIAGNFFYNCTSEKFFTGVITEEIATSNGGVVLVNNPVKDAAALDYTLVDALCLASNVGAARWNPNAGRVSSEITVGTVEELTTALDAGKAGITLKAGTYDLREVNESGVITLINPVSLTGKTGTEIIGGFKLGVGTTSFSAENIRFNGAEKALGNTFEIAEATELTKVQIIGCEIVGFNKSLFYGNGTDSKVDLFDFQKNLVHGFGTGQGMIDIRKGAYALVNISKNTFYDGGRDFARIDKGIAESVAIINNTFAACSIDAGNGLLWIRSCADEPAKYNVQKNLFLNLTGDKTVLAKSGATVPTMGQNWFFNVGGSFFTGAIDQAAATAGNGGVLTEDPCAGSAEFNLTLVNADLKKADIGDPRWNSASPNYKPRK